MSIIGDMESELRRCPWCNIMPVFTASNISGDPSAWFWSVSCKTLFCPVNPETRRISGGPMAALNIWNKSKNLKETNSEQT